MIDNNKTKIFILDTSVILSGKPISFDKNCMITSDGVTKELKPGGRDYNSFQFLIEKGLKVQIPSKESIDKINKTIEKTGDINRLSKTDIEILALSLDVNKEYGKIAIIVTDDYSIQNVANYLKISFQTINQAGITKRFIWNYRCRGCGKKFKENIKICPICGAETKTVISKKKGIKK